ncbi:MAG: hypothetical protein KatS3mg031_0129 [Chitinophagales bacterium]|nr:MAG: hypothetical protein KatS3mg031_0129 [Chitinophagales bacterium]
MTIADWIVMLGTLLFISGYGAWKTRGSKNIQSFLLGDNQSKWWVIGLSVMATQASAITFLSTPGQAYEDGMRFIQFYFGLPLAVIIICIAFIPLFYRLKVFTAYEFLESRFDLKTRILTASLFLLQRGLAAGITIYAPAIVLSQILGWSLNFTIIFIGMLVIFYTVVGGTKAVNQTHKHQMAIIFTGMVIAMVTLVWHISQHMTVATALQTAGKLGKMNLIDWELDFSNRYNIWSGLLGGLFLQLSYFGTDQSQVSRYLAGKSIAESRMGLLFNGLLKIPMQFFILLTGVLVFVFFQLTPAPVYFNQVALEKTRQLLPHEIHQLEQQQQQLFSEKRKELQQLALALQKKDSHEIARLQNNLLRKLKQEQQLRQQTQEVISSIIPSLEKKDSDYIFIYFVMHFLPAGLVGLLLAVIFSAAMSSTSAELNALASTATVDLYKRVFKSTAPEGHYLLASRIFTVFFGVAAILFALLASLFENLIQAVNILGSLFYGTILGIFITAFFLKHVKGNAVFVAALMAEMLVIVVYLLDKAEIVHVEYLWLNLIGCIAVMLLGSLLQMAQQHQS